MRKILVGLFLMVSVTMLSSCKLTESINAAVAVLRSEGTASSASAEIQAAKTAQAQAEQAAQAARTAQAQAEQAAAAAYAAQQQAEQYLASLQNTATQPTKTADRKTKKSLERQKPVTRIATPPPVVRKEVPKPAPPVAAKPVPVTPPPVAPTVPVGSLMSSSAESSIEAEEADAFAASDNYVARRNGQVQPKRAPASVGGATSALDPNRRAENEARFKRALALFESKDEQQNVKLTIIEPDGTRKLREVSVARLGLEGEQRMLARVISPADLKGAGVLVVATKQRDNQWVYLPSSKQTRKVVVAEQKGVILGSELRYEDFNPAAIRRSSVDLLKQERIEGKTYDIFEAMIPPGTVPYEKAWVWIDPKSEMPIQIEYFSAGEKVKRIEFSDYYKVGDIWRPAKLAIKNLKTKRGTDIEISNVKVNTGMPADRLSVEALSKVW